MTKIAKIPVVCKPGSQRALGAREGNVNRSLYSRYRFYSNYSQAEAVPGSLGFELLDEG